VAPAEIPFTVEVMVCEPNFMRESKPMDDIVYKLGEDTLYIQPTTVFTQEPDCEYEYTYAIFGLPSTPGIEYNKFESILKIEIAKEVSPDTILELAGLYNLTLVCEIIKPGLPMAVSLEFKLTFVDVNAIEEESSSSGFSVD